MSLLKDRRVAKEEKKWRKNQPARYAMNGKAIRGKPPVWKQAILIVVIVIALLAACIYVPPMFYKGETNTGAGPYTRLPADTAAIKAFQTYLKDNPDADYDKDGLTNAMESEYGCDAGSMDTDGDGVCDYAELYVTETSPTDATTVMIEQVQLLDAGQGTTIQTPYKIDDIIFWPDDYSSKSFGAVVRTLAGYRFCNFHGWVKFPETVYAYTYDGGLFTDLKYRSYEDAWRIDTSDEVLLYQQAPQFCYVLNLPIAGEFILPDTQMGSTLDQLLPDEGGPVTCYRTAIGIEETWAQPVSVAAIALPSFDRSDYSRLNTDMNRLTDLAWVYELLDKGQCVAVSMYSGSSGESIGIVYGYTRTGDLMVADESLQPAGMIKIDERARRMMDQDGNITQVSWFEWEGFGFDSARRGDKISFFASTLSNAQEQTNEMAGQEISDQVIADQVVPEQTVTEQTVPDQVVPEQTVTEQVVPEQVVPEQVVPEQVVPEQTVTEQVIADTQPATQAATDAQPATGETQAATQAPAETQAVPAETQAPAQPAAQGATDVQSATQAVTDAQTMTQAPAETQAATAAPETQAAQPAS